MILRLFLVEILLHLPTILCGEKHQKQKRLVVTTVLMEPYVMLRQFYTNHSTTGNHPTGTPNPSRYHGYSIDLLRAVSKLAGFRYKLYEVPDGSFGYVRPDGTWNGMIGQLLNQEADLAIGPMYPTSRRSKVVDFTRPYLNVEATLLMKKSSANKSAAIKSHRELLSRPEVQFGTLGRGLFIHVFKQTEDVYLKRLWHHMRSFSPSVFTATNSQGIARARRDPNFVYILPSTIGEYISRRWPCDLVVLDRFLLSEGYAWAVPKNAKLKARLDNALSVLDKAGYLDRIYRKWWVESSSCSGQVHSSKVYSSQPSYANTPKSIAIFAIVFALLPLRQCM